MINTTVKVQSSQKLTYMIHFQNTKGQGKVWESWGKQRAHFPGLESLGF